MKESLFIKIAIQIVKKNLENLQTDSVKLKPEHECLKPIIINTIQEFLKGPHMASYDKMNNKLISIGFR
jgi:hypothetical protein